MSAHLSSLLFELFWIQAKEVFAFDDDTDDSEDDEIQFYENQLRHYEKEKFQSELASDFESDDEGGEREGMLK